MKTVQVVRIQVTLDVQYIGDTFGISRNEPSPYPSPSFGRAREQEVGIY